VTEGGRVIAGAAKGIRLSVPGPGTRPLADRVKEALFATLEAEGAIGPGSAFLDLYAGSGAAGIEALSRGAARAVFVEHEAGACRVISANLDRGRLANGTVVRADALRLLENPATDAGAPFDAVLVDPPYASALVGPTLDRLAEPERGWLTDDAIVVAKHFWRDAPALQIGRLERYRERRFGETMLSFYRRR
jgi:16S rRNA (guanine966-N2)-methyltransferase